MAKNDKKTPKRVDWNQTTWVINNIPPKDLDIIDEMDWSDIDISEWMTERIESGASFKFSWDYDYGECPQISMNFDREGYKNAGYAISARGEDFEDCFKILWYKFEKCANADLENLTEVRHNRKRG